MTELPDTSFNAEGIAEFRANGGKVGGRSVIPIFALHGSPSCG